ncbi:hypothetical protein [Paraburkholderia fungorum]|uniref:Ribosomal protein L18E n=1 Tax=Paraburkholderia fungorum TaxID=134537 RepID=A0AAW3V546_9BURK|nr:hypothetical protein [Paraburkholderia fungorum]MBB4517437.1 ribosomal protein L18E [Paraburkholderia fungorum]MBB6204505.1 ribosomal protein L18E [Paraburkholderia fungorum]
MEIRELVIAAQAYWDSVNQTITTYGAEIARLRDVEQKLFSCESWAIGLEQYDESKQEKHLRRVVRYLMDHLVKIAVDKFSPSAAARISIDDSEVAEAAGCAGEDFRKFNAETFWNCLENRYGGTNGSNAAYRQAAASLIQEFRIKPDAAITVRKGCLVIDLNVRADKSKWSSSYKLDYSDQNQIARTVIALKSFASWADMTTLQFGLDHLVRRFSHGDGIVESRESFSYGNAESGQIKVTTFYTRFEFVFDPKVSGKLQLFLGEFGFTELAEAA